MASLAALFFILWIVYKVINGRFLRGIPGETIKVIERRFLDRNTSIVLVRLMEDYYYILVTQNGGTIIKKLDDLEASKIVVRESKEVDFKRIFYRRLGRK